MLLGTPAEESASIIIAVVIADDACCAGDGGKIKLVGLVLLVRVTHLMDYADQSGRIQTGQTK